MMKRADVDLTLSAALEITAAGVALLIAQAVVVTNPFFGTEEIKKYLRTRRTFQPLFARAAEQAAAFFDDETTLREVAAGLRIFANTGVREFQRGLAGVERALRSLRRVDYREIDPAVRSGLGRTFSALRAVSDLVGGELEWHEARFAWENLFSNLVRARSVPAPLRTLFRTIQKMQPNQILHDANPGAWFTMPPEERVRIRKLVLEARAMQDSVDRLGDPETRLRVYREQAEILGRLQAEAGVNVQIITHEDERPLTSVLKEERSLVRDGPTEYVVSQIMDDLRRTAAEYPDLYRKRGLNKLLGQMNKCKTFGTLMRVVREAVEREVLNRQWMTRLEDKMAQAQRNKAVASGIPLVPMPFAPVSADEFRARHTTGEIEFVGEWTEQEKENLLGRVSVALGHLEGIYGKGFCGSHAKKLAFRFHSGEFGMASATYFGWENRNLWQPRVTFAKGYEGLLAHELSHYLDDLLAFKAGKATGTVPDYAFGDVGHGAEHVFGATGLSVTAWLESASQLVDAPKVNAYNAALREVPEVLELMSLVVTLPDYARWSDKLGQLEEFIEPAVRKVMGKDPFHDAEVSHLMLGKVRYRSEVPPDVLEEAIRMFTRSRDGDTRKLTYWNSTTEVWARLCEQYVYTVLADAGVANPWLTRLTYDIEIEDAFVADETFVRKVKPIMDRLFARLKSRSFLASQIARQWIRRTSMGARRPRS